MIGELAKIIAGYQPPLDHRKVLEVELEIEPAAAGRHGARPASAYFNLAAVFQPCNCSAYFSLATMAFADKVNRQVRADLGLRAGGLEATVPALKRPCSICFTTPGMHPGSTGRSQCPGPRNRPFESASLRLGA